MSAKYEDISPITIIDFQKKNSEMINKIILEYFCEILITPIFYKWNLKTNFISQLKCYTVEPGISKLFQKHKKFTIARCLLSKGFDQSSNTQGIISRSTDY